MSFEDRFLTSRGAASAPHESAAERPGREATRREFLVTSLAAGSGFVLAMSGAGPVGAAIVQPDGSLPAGFAPNAFLRIGNDDTITVIAKHDEMGQGIHTGLAITVCEELEVDVDKVNVIPAWADPAFAHSLFGVQITGGSSSTHSSFQQMRQAGATAREMLLTAAAQRWNVPASECVADNGTVRRKNGSARLTYGELAEAAAALPVPKNVTLKSPDEFTRIGKPTPRVDSPSKVRGAAPFSLDRHVPGMLTALVARSPYFGGTLRSYDDYEARAMPGVAAIVQVPSGVAVVADGYWNAFKARRALRIDWDAGPGAAMHSERLRRDYLLRAKTKGLVAEEVGDADRIIETSDARLDAIYEVPFQAHAPMEPLSCLVTLRPDGGADLVTGSQLLGADHPAVASRLGVDLSKVSIENVYLGGGFGRRANPVSDFLIEAVDVAKAARDLGAPIKTVWSREDDIRGGWYRPMFINAMSAALDDRTLRAWRHRIVGQSIAAGTAFEAVMVRHGLDETSVEGATRLPYAVANRTVELHTTALPVPVQWWRSVGHSNTAFAKESFLDEIAEALERDPYELRRELLAEHPRLRRVLEHVATKSGWQSAVKPGIGRGIAVHESFKGFAAHVVEASVERGRPKIHRIVCAIDCGPVVNPDQVVAQMQGAAIFALSAVLDGEITFEQGRVVQSNFNDFQIVRMQDTPPIEVHIVDSDDAMGGVGEVGVPGIASAVCGASPPAPGGFGGFRSVISLPRETAVTNPMNEWRRMVAAADADEGRACLATVVDVAGSAYRRPGARMLVRSNGAHVGGISGGCLERDLCRSISWLTREGPRVVSFDTRDDAARINPRYNLGCSGVIHVLLERLTRDTRCPLAPIRSVLEDDRPRTVGTVYHTEGARFAPVGTRFASDELARRFGALSPCLDRVRSSGHAVCCELVAGSASCRLLVERLDPPKPLWIFGAGDDAQPLAAMAAQLGWNVTVVDSRAERLTSARFPAAIERLAVHPRDASTRLHATDRTAAILMTHSFSDDADLLPWLLASAATYVGLLGPKARAAKLMRRLQTQGRLPEPGALDRLHTPVGLDLGGSSPAEVALAVLGEIVAERNGRCGGRLERRRGPIHEPAAHVMIDVSEGASMPNLMTRGSR